MRKFTEKLTQKEGDYIWGKTPDDELLEYVGKLEDIEEKLGIGLIELFELVGKDAYSIEDDYIIEYEIKAIELKDDWFIRTDVSNFGITKCLWLPDFNKTWFLSEEAAEKKLRELENDID